MLITTDLATGLITFTLTDATSFTKTAATIAKVTGLSLRDAVAFTEILWESDSGELSFVA